jgi:hypothetical protein
MVCSLINLFRTDGRIYKGSWFNSKQHGEGEFFVVGKNEWIKGVWNEGHRINMQGLGNDNDNINI